MNANRLGHIVVGLGSGRSGTASLASLIDRQPGGLCFHEMNPSGAVFAGNAQAQLNTVTELRAILAGGDRSRLSIDYSRPASVATYAKLQSMHQPMLLGDIGFYYLSYVEDILALVPECKFVCIRRDRDKTISSWLKKSRVKRWRSLWLADRLKALVTRTPFQTEYNYWQEHDGSVWMPDPVWDSCFPKFEAVSKQEAIGKYWDYYYREAARLAEANPGSFAVFDITDLSSVEGQQSILRFIGLPADQMVCGGEVHLHKSRE
jgi:hypothetical protein